MKEDDKDVLDSESSKLDAKFSLQIKVSKSGSSKEQLRSQKGRDLEEIRKELAKRDEKLVQQYLRGMEDKPVVMPNDKLSQDILQMTMGGHDRHMVQKAVDAINPKISQQMIETIAKTERNKRLHKKYGWTLSHLLRGKLGVDAFFVFFAFTAVVGIPVYYLYKQQRVKNFMRENNIAPISVEDLAEEEFKHLDLDDISKHVTYYNTSEYREQLRMKLQRSKEKEKLRQELYSSIEREKERYLFNTPSSSSNPKPSAR